MRLAWTAVVPRNLVERFDPMALARQDSRFTVLPHPDPALRVVQCYRPGRLLHPPAA